MEVQNYEHLRNLTLLFFLEKLLDKGEDGRRSLHDLSCQFGTKGFSKEMRQIAGGSKAGLKRFLSQYPSLFCVTDEYVSVATIPSSKYGGVGGGNGPGQGGSNGEGGGAGAAGGRDYGQEAVAYFSNKLRQYGESIEVPIKSLLGHRSQAPPEVRHVSGQHMKEFRDFLLNYPDDFVVNEESETVYLKEFGGTITKVFSEGSNEAAAATAAGGGATTSSQDNALLAESISAQLSSGPTPLGDLLARLTRDFESRGKEFPYSTPENLRTFLKIYPGTFQMQGGTVSLALPANHQHQQQAANLTSQQQQQQQTPPASPSKQLNLSNSRISLKDRVSSVVQKAVADNSSSSSTPSFSRLLADQGPPPSSPSPASSSSGGFSAERVRVLTQAESCRSALAEVSRSWKAVAVEVKGINLGPEGRVSSIHLSNADDRGGGGSVGTYVFDFLQLPSAIIKDDFKPILENDNILKVLHDCRNESATLWFQHNIMMSNVFDTQAAYAVIQHQDNVSSVHKVKHVSLVSLCRHFELGGVAEELVQHKTKRDQKFWLKRPMEQEAVYMAALEVHVLSALLYPKLKSLLRASSLPLFDTLCEEQLKMHVDPELVKGRKTQRKIELEVKDIREKLNKASNGKNVVLSNREIRLLRFVDLSDEDVKKIKGSAKVAKKLERLTNPPPSGDDANPPSLESVSSDSSGGDLAANNSSSDLQGLERIEKLEALLANLPGSHDSLASAAASLSSMPSSSETPPHRLTPHSSPLRMQPQPQLVQQQQQQQQQQGLRNPMRSAVSAGNLVSSPPPRQIASATQTVSTGTQTLSTGDIVMTKVFAEQ